MKYEYLLKESTNLCFVYLFCFCFEVMLCVLGRDFGLLNLLGHVILPTRCSS